MTIESDYIRLAEPDDRPVRAQLSLYETIALTRLGLENIRSRMNDLMLDEVTSSGSRL